MRTAPARSLLLLAAVAGLAAGCATSSSDTGASSSQRAAVAPSIGAGGASGTAGAQAVGSAPDAPVSGASGRGRAIGVTVTPGRADIVEDGTVTVRVRDAAAVGDDYRAIPAMAVAAGGFVSASSLSGGTVPTASMTLRVPNAAVGGVEDRIAALGHETDVTLDGRDVTGQVVDLGLEITNLTSEETAVRGLLSRAGTVSAILTVQQQLFSLQDEIQELRAQTSSLDDRVRYATLSVSLTTAPPPPVHHRRTTLSRFTHLAGSHTVGLVRGVILAVGWSAPGLVLLAVAGSVVLAVRRRRRPRVTLATAPDDAG